jgi:hypothetical protein
MVSSVPARTVVQHLLFHSLGNDRAFLVTRYRERVLRQEYSVAEVRPNPACTRLALRAVNSGESSSRRFRLASESSQTRASG